MFLIGYVEHTDNKSQLTVHNGRWLTEEILRVRWHKTGHSDNHSFVEQGCANSTDDTELTQRTVLMRYARHHIQLILE